MGGRDIVLDEKPPITVPTPHHIIHARIPEQLLPSQLDCTRLLNAVIAQLSVPALRPRPAQVWCHGPATRSTQLAEVIPQLQSPRIHTGHRSLSAYLGALADHHHRRTDSVHLFYSREVPLSYKEVHLYSQSFDQVHPEVLEESITRLTNTLQSDTQLFPAHSAVLPSVFATNKAGEFFRWNISASCTEFLRSNLAQVRKKLKNRNFAELHSPLYHAGWGVCGLSWHTPSHAAPFRQQTFYEARLHLAPGKLSYTSVAQLCNSLCQWVEKKLTTHSRHLAALYLSAPTLPLIGAFSQGLEPLVTAHNANEVFFPDFAYGWSPLQNLLMLMGSRTGLYVSARSFPEIQCFLSIDHEMV